MILKDLSKRLIKESIIGKESFSAGEKISIEGITPASFPIIISSIFSREPKQILLVTTGSQKLNELYGDLTSFIDESLVYPFPALGTLPYEFMSPTETVERDRITAIYKAMSGEPAIFLTTTEGLIRRIPEKNFFLKKGLELEKDEDYPFDDVIETLIQYGYTRETRVESFGQFSVKGSIVDVFLPSLENPVRLDFFGDTLDTIREFDLNSQVSTGLNRYDTITIYPRKELIFFPKEETKLKEEIRSSLPDKADLPDHFASWLNSEEPDSEYIAGSEDLFHRIIEADTIDNFLEEDALIVFLESPDILNDHRMISKNFSELYTKRKDKIPALSAETLLDLDKTDSLLEKSILLQSYRVTPEAMTPDFKTPKNYQGKIKIVREELAELLSQGWEVIMTTSFEGQARRLADLFRELGPDKDFDSYNSESSFNILICPLSQGAELNELKTIILTDHEIFGKSYRKRRQFKDKSSKPIESFLDLKPGDYVVHINHGIGIFNKIERMSAGGVERDFLLIDYKDGDKLYVSLDQINLIQKYIGLDGRQPKVDCLGKKSAWNKVKQKVQETVEEIAKELIKIYSKRNALKGHRFPPDTQWQEEFESLFEYEETPDQITAIEDTKDDMESEKPMDRLICGDVGFGKTEVAIRASFKAVMAGKQVALLVPTTVLAMQHFETFRKRFSNYPINIEMMSRFKTASQLSKVKENLAAGETDIVIGTHALISKDMKIKNLGLLIIDEEQRFGVKHKEQLKKFRTMVDVLTLSATPIPRTLHMSLAGIRDLSLITTPPENRQSVETFVMEDNPDVLRKAILNEIERNGQAFFVHNRVQTIDTQMILLEKLIPEATFAVAHGQMNEHELEEIMIDFMHHKFDVLISTTIIESGLDIPNANTIIINRADTFGLSQLYQLKGRVGRSNIKAHAYMFYPKHTSLTEDAQKRLKVISEYSELGSGFKIAMKDLEIRGSGNILGKEQSGSIMEVGFDLYCQMLNDSVKKLKGEEVKSYFRSSIFINTDFYIPDSYIDDDKQKIEFYKRFESCESIEEVDSLETEMIDRFGLPPMEVTILVDIERIRTLASELTIDEIREDSKNFRIKITEESTLDRTKLVSEISENKNLTVDTKDPSILLLNIEKMNLEKKTGTLKKWLQLFTS